MSSVIRFCGYYEFLPLDIHTAASLGKYEEIHQMIGIFPSFNFQDIRSFVNQPNKQNWTPLMYASHCGENKVAELLLQYGADVNAKNFSRITSLMLAADCGHHSTSLLLLNHGANLHACDNQRWTALFYACLCDQLSVVQLFLEKGSAVNSVDIKGISCLMLAAEAGHESVVRVLLQNNAIVSLCSKSGETASSLALVKGHYKIKTILDLFTSEKSPKLQNVKTLEQESLLSVLESLNLTKYYPIFEHQGINLKSFWTLSDKDLIDMGIKLLGPRKKITLAIEQWHRRRDFSAMP